MVDIAKVTKTLQSLRTHRGVHEGMADTEWWVATMWCEKPHVEATFDFHVGCYGCLNFVRRLENAGLHKISYEPSKRD